MEAATKLGLPWRLLREKLAPPENNGVTTDVNYRKTLEMLDTDLIVISNFLYYIWLQVDEKLISNFRKLHTQAPHPLQILYIKIKVVWKWSSVF